jgi:hypothetical protein
VAALAAGWGAAARANDSTAAFAAGGLILTETDAIVLVDEELVVARDAVHVRYTFENRSAADVETLVAFPLPDIDLATYSEVPIQPPAPDADNFVGFTVRVDGVPVEPAIHVTATLGARDVTGVLADAGLPVSLFAEDLYERLWAIPREVQDDLQQQTLAYYERDYEAVYPQWTQHVSFTWTQVFPAGRPIVVEHDYKPVVGTRFISGYSLTVDDQAEFRARYCLDDDRAALEERLAAAPGGVAEGLLVADEVGYILTTGNNWAGPMGRLSITVDPGGAGNLALTCYDGLTRSSDGRLHGTFETANPKDDLWILIVRREPES